MHTVFPSPSAQSGVPYLRKRSRSPWFRFLAPSAVSMPRGPHSAKATWFPLAWLPCLGLNPSASLPLQPHFRLLPQSVTPASIPVFSQLYWAAIVSLGRCGPMAWSQSSPSSQRRPCNQGELPPSYILGGSHSPPPGSKHGHSYLTYP